jgi:catechol 2,3-dioxygenase-like lactoylglutathione lyase family enzyme
MMDGAGGILECALYYPHSRREDVLRFYDETLAMRRVAGWDDGTAYRLGPGVLLLFDRDLLAGRDGPVADHGADGAGHVCLVADPGRYDELRERIAAAGLEITHDHEWSEGKRSFYFKDPAGNLLEVADSDLWPG